MQNVILEPFRSGLVWISRLLFSGRQWNLTLMIDKERSDILLCTLGAQSLNRDIGICGTKQNRREETQASVNNSEDGRYF